MEHDEPVGARKTASELLSIDVGFVCEQQGYGQNTKPAEIDRSGAVFVIEEQAN